MDRSQPNSSLAGLRILIAEDEGLIALELETELQDLGCEVVGPILSVKGVRRAAEAGHLDGALLDVNLRDEQIFSVLPYLIERQVPIIITSGYDDARLFPADYGTLPRLTKPVDRMALRSLCLSVFAGEPAADKQACG